LLALESSDEQIQQARLIADGKLSARDAEQIAAKKRSERNSGTRRPANRGSDLDPNLKALRDSIQRALKRKVQITHHHGRRPGRIELEYYSDDDLNILASALVRHVPQ
jgi:hypothetical protein